MRYYTYDFSHYGRKIESCESESKHGKSVLSEQQEEERREPLTVDSVDKNSQRILL